MAEDDGGLFDAFLNAQSKLTREDGQTIFIVDSENPVSWWRVFGSAVGGVFATYVSGIAQIPLNIANAINNIIGGILSILLGRLATSSDGTIDGSAGTIKIDGLFDVVFGGLSSAAVGMWSAPLDRFGLIGLPVSVFLLLATVYIVVQGFRVAFAILRGEEVF